GGTTAWWGVENIDAAMNHLTSIGAEVSAAPSEVGSGIKVASVLDPFGNHVGIIENPHFDPAATK
ncbi:MAG: VOC family protein, partial [Gemmatimonadaceae bacterium]